VSATQKIVGLKLKRVSLCADPANEFAKVALFKSRDGARKDDMGDINCSCGATMSKGTKVCPSCGKEMSMKVDLSKITDADTRKAVEAVIADLAAAEKLAQEEQDKRVAADKAKDVAEKALKEAVEKAKPAPSDEDLLKALPPALRARLEKSEKDAKEASDAVKAMAEKARETEFIAKAKVFGNLSVDASKFGPVLKRIADGTSTKEDVAEIERVLKGANEIAKKALFTQRGSANAGAGATGEAWAMVQKQAEELRAEVLKSGTKITLPEAMDRVIKANPELYEQHLREFSGKVRSAVAGGAVNDGEEE
jgi:hypothetical protein